MPTLLPKLRRQDWHRAKEAWARPLVANIPSTEIPLVTHVYDLGDRTGTILTEHLQDETRSPAELEAEAIRNLEARPIKWQTQSVGQSVLALCSDEYAPELILSPARMAEAAELVGDKLLAVSMPSDALIVVGSGAMDLALKGTALQQMFATGRDIFEKYKQKDQHLTPEIFNVTEGKVVGVIRPMSSVPEAQRPPGAGTAPAPASTPAAQSTAPNLRVPGPLLAIGALGLIAWVLTGAGGKLGLAAGLLVLVGALVWVNRAK